jgi:hypothetical protein
VGCLARIIVNVRVSTLALERFGSERSRFVGLSITQCDPRFLREPFAGQAAETMKKHEQRGHREKHPRHRNHGALEGKG